jgi:hypothetical protein
MAPATGCRHVSQKLFLIYPHPRLLELCRHARSVVGLIARFLLSAMPRLNLKCGVAISVDFINAQDIRARSDELSANS